MNLFILLTVFFTSACFYTEAATAQKTCPKGFSLFKNKKCLKFEPGYLGHREAEADCRTYGGHLVTAHNAIDNRGISDLASNHGLAYIWMGVFCFGNSTTMCYMDDGTGALKYDNFKAGFPRIDKERSGCVFMETFGNDIGKWSTSPCEWTGLEYVCEVPTTVADPDPTCTHNYNGYCYYPSHELSIPQINRTFYSTQDICHTHSMELVSIHSLAENDYIKSLYSQSGIQQLFLGAHANVPGSFSWTDGSKYSYHNVDPLSTSTGSCLSMALSGRNDIGMWAESSCLQIEEFMCKRKAGASKVVAETMDVNPKFQITKDTPLQHLELSSHCNETLYLAPGVITSLSYPSKQLPASFCTWKVAVLGQYRLGIYYTDFSVYQPVYVYSSNGTVLSNAQYQRDPFNVLAPDNMVTISHDNTDDAAYNHYGFKATVLPF